MGELYEWIKSLDYITEEEMLKVFNCGFGMLVILSEEEWHKLKTDEYIVLGKVI